jgi:hypothetical protein
MANKLATAEIAIRDLDDWASGMSRTHLKNVQHQGDGIKVQEAGARAEDVHYHGMGKWANSGHIQDGCV